MTWTVINFAFIRQSLDNALDGLFITELLTESKLSLFHDSIICDRCLFTGISPPSPPPTPLPLHISRNRQMRR